ITIGNVTYNVSVPNNRLLIKLSSMMNATSPTAVIDFYPSVLQIYAANQTIFVLVPSLKGIVIKGLPLNGTQAHVGVKARLENSARAEIERLTPNITVTSSTLMVHNTSVDFSLTVKDNSNSSVTVKDVMLSGYMRRIGPIAMPIIGKTVTKMPTSVDVGGGEFATGSFGDLLSGLNSSSLSALLHDLNLSNINMSNVSSIISNVSRVLSEHGISISDMKGFNASDMQGFLLGIGNLSNSTKGMLGNVLSSRMNASVLEDLRNLNVSNTSVDDVLHEVNNFSRYYHNTLNFIVLSNGTLSLPFATAVFENEQVNRQNGYNISAGSSATFSFNSTIGIGSSPFHILPLVNQTYSVRIVGEDGARASTNVTAS
ncbi:MAG: hypothetical protein QXW10_04130, partial [Candidatus Micrarchaeaceae archaeon]